MSHFDEDRLQHSREQLSALKAEESSQNHLAQYLGKGYIAFTVDQPGSGKDRYQGVVELKGSSLVECVQHYFSQSEQIGTAIKMAVGQRDGAWRSGAIMLQHMPEDQAKMAAGQENAREDDWRRSMILMESCTEGEFLDPALHSNTLLHRLFHEEGVRVYEPLSVYKSCRCDRERVERVLCGMSQEDLDHMVEDGQIEVKCEFCAQDFIFDLEDIRGKIMS